MSAAPSTQQGTPPCTVNPADLEALPSDWRLCRVGRNKAPIGGEGWYENDRHSPDEALALNGNGPPAWGLLCGEASGVIVLDLDAEGWRESFQQFTGHPISDLPKTISWTSGKPGRSGHAFAVDPDWWLHLANRRSFSRPWREGDPLDREAKRKPQTTWELRGNRCQSVIVGAHPETGAYRWLPGRSPHDIPEPAPAPEWLLELLAVVEHPDAPPVELTAEDAGRAVAMLDCIPASEHSNYDAWLRIGMALHHTDPGLLAAWVDWCRGMGAAFDEAECLAKWQGFGRGHRGRPATIRTLHHLAKQHGYHEPSRRPDPLEGFGAVDGAGGSRPMGVAAGDGPTGGQGAAADEGPKDPATVAQQAIRGALADGVSGAEMESLLVGLAKRTGLNPFNLRQMVEAHQVEAQGVEMVAAEAKRLAERIAQQQAGKALTLEHLFAAPIAEALALRTRYLPADPCAVAVLYLPSIASLQKIGSRITGSPASGFTVPLNCWGGVVAKSGQKKTPLLGKVVKDPTATIRQALAEGNYRERQQWQDAQKGPKKDEPKAPPPQPVHLHVGDVTTEALAAQLVALADRGRGLLVLRDELAGLFNGLDMYRGGRGNDGQFLLELFDGGSHTSLRVSCTREFRDSLVSITGCIQPKVLEDLVNASTGDADGRYARFLLAPLTEPPKPLPVAIDPKEQQAIDRAGLYLQEVAAAMHCAPSVELHLGADALELFAQYEHRQALAAAAATIPAQGAVLGKAAGKVLRVAGLLHRLDGIANDTTGCVVGADPLLRAIDLVEHLNRWVLGLHADLTDGCEPTGLMRKIHDTATALKEPLQWRKFRDRLTPGQKKSWDRPGFDAAAQALADLGVGRVEQVPGGRCAYVATGRLP